jgi:aminoglycoside phosphotransferase (APT) family kinase protein
MATFPTTIEAIGPTFLSEVLGRAVLEVSATQLGEPYTSWVATLQVSLADGTTERLVAKVRRPERTNVRLYTQEVHFYTDVARRLSCVPRAHFAQLGSDGDFLLLLEQVGGRHVREGLDAPTARRALEAIARVHGACWGDDALDLPVRVHSADEAGSLVESLHTHWDDVARRFPHALTSPPPLDDLPAEVARLEATTLTHNDLHADNVLCDEDRVVFLDWQNATRSTPMVDAANLIAGCVRPEVQREHWRALLAHYEAALVSAGGPALPDVVDRYATATGLLFGWVMRYLASVSDAEAAGRVLLRDHWERVSTGVALPRNAR